LPPEYGEVPKVAGVKFIDPVIVVEIVVNQKRQARQFFRWYYHGGRHSFKRICEKIKQQNLKRQI
jgi:hypothetical protein